MMRRRFGVEQEHFLFRKDGGVPSDSDIEMFYDVLQKSTSVTRLRGTSGLTMKVSYSTSHGMVDVKNDFCSNILEVVFPPLHCPVGFREIWNDVFSRIFDSLDCSGLMLRLGGSIDTPPDSVCLRLCDTDPDGERQSQYLNRVATGKPLFHRYAGACMCATQVSCDIARKYALSRLAEYYSFEYLVPLGFGNSPLFLGRRGRCVRHFLYKDNWPDDYQLLAVPSNIPASDVEMDVLRQKVYRDYSYVAIRDGRVEFRSACSQNRLEDVLELVALRLMIDASVQVNAFSMAKDSASYFSEASEAGVFCMPAVSHDISVLRNSLIHLPLEWRSYAESALVRYAAMSECVDLTGDALV